MLFPVGGGEGEEIGGLRIGGEVEGVLAGSGGGEAYLLAMARHVGQGGGGERLGADDSHLPAGRVGVNFNFQFH